MRLFRKKNTADHNDIVNEKWHTSFSRFQEHRFMPEEAEDYSSSVLHGVLNLELRRKNLFAWTDNPLYRYDDFLLTASLGISSSNKYSSTGFLFRRTDDLSYYYFLVSNRGHYRLDSVLNGMPQVLIDWTPCPEFDPEKFNLMIYAYGSSISLFIDNKWIGDASDDSLFAGGISFAGQNYNEAENAVFTLNSIDIESRPAQLDTWSIKHSAAASADARLLFAESQMRSGRYQSALIEIRKVLKENAGCEGVENRDALLKAADCCINLEMYTEAANCLERIPEEDRDERCLLQRAAILYMTDEFFALRDMLKDNPQLLQNSPPAANFLGNAEYALGNWEPAARAYEAAFEADEKQALYAFNAARAFEKSANPDKASVMYGNAARIYFRAGDYDELAGIFPCLEKLDANGAETLILKAKLLFQDSDFDAANKIFTNLIKNKTADSTVYYLNALIEARNSRPRKAEASFVKAIKLEPDYHLYHFKYAEYLFLCGGKYPDSLKRALELAPEDPWVLNLAGLASLENQEPAEAANYFASASAIAPEENEIAANHSEALFIAGRTDEAMSLLTGNSAEICNQRGNIHARLNNYQQAVAEYEAAFTADRDNTDICLNLAAACIETDSFSRAEELLIRVLESGDNARAYNLVGNLSLLKGEYSRAEAAYGKALDIEPGFLDAVCNLAELYISRERLNEADLLLSGVSSENTGERYNTLKEFVFRRRMNIYSCSSCSEEWIVPKKIGSQPALRIVGEPADEMPAGKCPECGKAFCIGCVKDNTTDGRLVCKDCGLPLKLSEDWIRYLYHEHKF